MGVRIKKLKNVFISDKLNPNYIEVIKTYLWAQNIKYTVSNSMPENEEFACAIYSYPEYSGELKHLPDKKNKEIIT